ncbi:MAG: intradiol ring-cleavage dioxygenase [Burkholderiales bacterium]|nr:intradiol ring-cleavage dioxygenase [Burkholderiales bacterium]
MRNIDASTITPAVIARLAHTEDPRLKQILTSLVTHLHDFAREVSLTEDEWMQGIQFLTATGQKCDAKRQEFILLSDTLGLSMLVVAMNHAKPAGATEATVFGPFHVEDAPTMAQDADLATGAPGEPFFVKVHIHDLAGQPIAGAEVDVWQADDDGLYDVQRPELGDTRRARGVLHTGAAGTVRFRTVAPTAYPVPTDGPVGRMLLASGRHPWRPAHLHFRIRAPGFQTLVTHIFRSGDPYLDSDAVFGVRSSLISDYVRHDPGPAPDGTNLDVPFYTMDQTFRLAPAAAAG